MAVKHFKTVILDFLKKYKYVALVLLLGLALMLIPGKKERQENITSPQSDASTETENQYSSQEHLSQVLQCIDGVGKVKLYLSVSKGEESIFQTDTHTSTAADNSSTQIDTVIISNADRGQSGLIRQINPPVYLGAIVVCQGADSPSVRLAIVDAVSKVTGLGADRISVLKMK